MSNTTRSALVKTLALVAGLASQPALALSPSVSHRDFQAYGFDFQLNSDDQSEWRKANGAEIIAGFAGPGDEVNTRTGQLRRR